MGYPRVIWTDDVAVPYKSVCRNLPWGASSVHHVIAARPVVPPGAQGAFPPEPPTLGDLMRLGERWGREILRDLAREIHAQFYRFVTARDKRLTRRKPLLPLAKLYDPCGAKALLAWRTKAHKDTAWQDGLVRVALVDCARALLGCKVDKSSNVCSCTVGIMLSLLVVTPQHAQERGGPQNFPVYPQQAHRA